MRIENVDNTVMFAANKDAYDTLIKSINELLKDGCVIGNIDMTSGTVNFQEDIDMTIRLNIITKDKYT